MKVSSRKHWSNTSLKELIEYIEQDCEDIVEKLMPELQQLLENITKTNEYNPLFVNLEKQFAIFKLDTEVRCLTEKTILFPYIRKMDSYNKDSNTKPDIPEHIIDDPVSLVQFEHDRTNDTLLRDICNNVLDCRISEKDSATFKNLYDGIRKLEEKINKHFNLINEFLLPKAIELEMLIKYGETSTPKIEH